MDLLPLAGKFTTFGPSHLVMLAVFVVGIWPIVRIGRAHRGTPAARRFSRGFAIAIPAVTLPLQVIDFLPGQFSFNTTLPIQLCDLAWVAATYALWTHRPFAAALTYYWGLVLTSQALITPELAADFPAPKFLAYWAMHLLIVWSAIYLTWGLGIHPNWRLLRATVLTTLVWALAVFTFNVFAGTNYGFLNEKPSPPSILDLFGPWPVYVVVEVVVLLIVWALITWPWVASDSYHGRRPDSFRGPMSRPGRRT